MTGFIPEDIVGRIKTDSDILDLVSEFVSLKKTGKDYTGLCPFHREKTPSFTVIPAKGFYYCFGCGASGNAVNFVMRHENLDYPDALRYLARRAGITIPEKSTYDSLTGKLYNAIEYSQSYFINNLKNSSAYKYLQSRNIKDETIKELCLGYSPYGWDNLYSILKKEKLSSEIFEKAGLLVKSEKRSDYIDKFRNRLMFPIFNVSGRPVGFGGRTLSNEEGPKYLNSPETRIYNKGSILYGLNWSKNYIRQSGKAIVTEGYFDYITLYQSGIRNVVAVSGTGFTANQANLLARFAKEVVLLYDSDSAGMKATFRAVDVLYNSNLEPLIVRLPEGLDPDNFVKENGSGKLTELINNAKEYLDFIHDTLPDRFVKLPLLRQEKIIDSLVETASGIDDNVKHDLFVRKTIETFDLPDGVIVKFQKQESIQKIPRGPELSGRNMFEVSFISLLISHPELISESSKIIKANNFSELLNKEIYEKLIKLDVNNLMTGDLLEHVHDENVCRRLTEIIIDETAGAPPEVLFSEYIDKFKKYDISDRLSVIRAEIARAEREGDLEKSERLNRKFHDLQISANRKVV